jgi:hypothetical protein
MTAKTGNNKKQTQPKNNELEFKKFAAYENDDQNQNRSKMNGTQQSELQLALPANPKTCRATGCFGKTNPTHLFCLLIFVLR